MRSIRQTRWFLTWSALAAVMALGACKRSAPAQAPADETTEGEAEDRPRMVSATADLPVDLRDFSAIKERGTLRVLVDATEESFLSHQGRSASNDRQLVSAFAERHGLEVEFILAERFDQLIPLLNEGRGDLIAADLTVTPERRKQVAFTRPTASAQELVVGRKGAENPKTAAELAGREIHVRAGTSYAQTIADLAAEVAAGVKVVHADEDPEQMVYEVAIGQRPLTVVDSHLLSAIETYEDRVEPLFSIADGRDIAWAARRENAELLAAVNAFLMETALMKHSRVLFTGDLDEIRKRGVLRVLTRNNPVTYFLWKGRKFGFDFELAQMAAKELGVRLQMVVVPSRDQLIPWLLEGRGDVIAASFSITPERAQQVAFSRPYLLVDEILVQRTAGPKVASLEELAGKKVHVRASSSYSDTLEALKKSVALDVVEADETDETELLLEQLAEGAIDFTVADSHLLEAELSWRSDVEAAFPLSASAGEDEEEGAGKKEIAFAVRPGSEQLRAFLDGFVKRTYRGLEYNMARKRYFANRRTAAQAKERSDRSGRISPYDDLIRKYSAMYGLDWRLMAALAYQESGFDPKAESWVGAKGLFQVMPVTGASMGFTDLENPEIGTHAGVRYVDWVIKQLPSSIPFHQRVRFGLASYNAGLGHVLDARRLAAEKGWDPDKWFGHVSKAMLLLQKPEYYKRARHGYCRGSEPVKYVSEIQARYENYVKVMPE